MDNPEKAAALLEQKLSCREYEVLPQGILHIHSYLDQPGEVSRLLTGEGITLLSMEVKDTQLEEYFISLVGGERNA